MPATITADTVAFVGDTHCSITWTERIVRRIHDEGSAGHIIQLGDFGYWPRHRAGEHFLDRLDHVLDRTDQTLWFVRGNHEDQEVLLAHVPEDDGLVTIRPRIRFIPDGTVLTWGARKILAVGGAPSIDADARVPGIDWFPSEVLTQAGYDTAMAAGQVDIVISHDCPAGVTIPNLYPWPPGDRHREVLARIAASAQPQLWIHGHYHQRQTRTVDSWGRECRVEAVNRDTTHGAVVLVSADLATTDMKGTGRRPRLDLRTATAPAAI